MAVTNTHYQTILLLLPISLEPTYMIKGVASIATTTSSMLTLTIIYAHKTVVTIIWVEGRLLPPSAIGPPTLQSLYKPSNRGLGTQGRTQQCEPESVWPEKIAKLINAKGLKSCPKSNKSPNLVTLTRTHVLLFVIEICQKRYHCISMDVPLSTDALKM